MEQKSAINLISCHTNNFTFHRSAPIIILNPEKEKRQKRISLPFRYALILTLVLSNDNTKLSYSSKMKALNIFIHS